MRKVFLGMSGGVDSTVSAYLLRENGFEPEGVSFVLWESRCRSDFTACCSTEAVEAAEEAAKTMGIRHRAVDVRGEFLEKVIEPFVRAYLSGLTPNPCILCNINIKFPYLLREARISGSEFISTGHYARVERLMEAGSERAVLKKGLDPGKDQSYVLYGMKPEELRSLVLPLGEYMKSQVRETARKLGLAAADRPESQEICFIENDDYQAFVERLHPEANLAGPILDASGRKLGMHKGVFRYTIGQRKGLGLSSPEPLFVTDIDVRNNTIRVGSRTDAMIRVLKLGELNCLYPYESGGFRADVKIRSMMKAVPATVRIDADAAEVVFDEPQWAPAPGQSAVFYLGDILLGGGVILPGNVKS